MSDDRPPADDIHRLRDDEPTRVGMPPPAPTDLPPAASDSAPASYGEGPPPRPGASYLLIGLLAGGLLLLVGLGALYALGLGPFGAGTPATGVVTPTPTQAGPTPAGSPTTGQPTPTPTLPGGSSPTPPPATEPPTTPPAQLGDPERLLGHIPAAVREGCIAVEDEDALALATCLVDDGNIVVVYSLYANNAAMQATYDAYAALGEIEPGSGTCADIDTWPAEGDYAIDGRPVGRMLCIETGTAPAIYWTDERLSIFSFARGSTAGAERLYQFWQSEAGPTE